MWVSGGALVPPSDPMRWQAAQFFSRYTCVPRAIGSVALGSEHPIASTHAASASPKSRIIRG